VEAGKLLTNKQQRFWCIEKRIYRQALSGEWVLIVVVVVAHATVDNHVKYTRHYLQCRRPKTLPLNYLN